MPPVWVMAPGAGGGVGAGQRFGAIGNVHMSEAIGTKRPGNDAIMATQTGADSRARNFDVALDNVPHMAAVTIRFALRALPCAQYGRQPQQQDKNRGLHGRSIGTAVPQLYCPLPDVRSRRTLCAVDE